MKNCPHDCHGKNPPQLVHLRAYRPFWMSPLPLHSSHWRWIKMRFPNSYAAITKGESPIHSPNHSCHSSMPVPSSASSMDRAANVSTTASEATKPASMASEGSAAVVVDALRPEKEVEPRCRPRERP